MNGLELSDLFERTLGGGAGIATAPILALGVGVVLFLIADIAPPLRPLRRFLFPAALGAAGLLELRLFAMDEPPGRVLLDTFVADRTTAIWGLVFLATAFASWLYAEGYYEEEKPYKSEHDALLLTAPAGMMLMVGARDLLVFFVGLELLSIPLYALCAFQRAHARSVEAGIKYFLLGSFSSALFLYGAALLYANGGSLDLAVLLSGDLGTVTALAGLALVFASLCFKLAIFPFHLWVPDVYQGSPTPVTAFMASGTKAAAFGFLLALMPLLPAASAPVVAGLALATMALGNLGALVQTDLKRMLAYSGVAHAGTLLLVVAGGVATRGPDGAAVSAGATSAALFYMLAYLFSATGAFGVVGLLEKDGSTSLDSLRGLARSRPVLSAALSLFLLSLGGIPATGGFLGKWFVFAVLVQADRIGIAVAGALLSVVALGYYLRVLVVLYMQPAPEAAPGGAPAEAPRRWSFVATGICGLFVVLTGVLPGLFLPWMGGN